MFEYNITGENFDIIPDDAIGIIAFHNDIPLQYVDTEDAAHKFVIASRNEESLVLRHNSSAVHYAPSFLGAIVSGDRSRIYWVNNTNPLP